MIVHLKYWYTNITQSNEIFMHALKKRIKLGNKVVPFTACVVTLAFVGGLFTRFVELETSPYQGLGISRKVNPVNLIVMWVMNTKVPPCRCSNESTFP
jgi:hypothetical protein